MAKDTGKLLARALGDAERLRADLRTARGNVRRYKGKAAKTRARRRVQDIEHKLDLAVTRVEKHAGTATREVYGEASALEWEIGASYESGRTDQAVMINVRIYKTNGQTVTEKEAKNVARSIHEGAKIPSGFATQWVNWRRGDADTGNWSHSDYDDWRGANKAADLSGGLSGPLATVFLEDYRISPVKDDDE